MHSKNEKIFFFNGDMLQVFETLWCISSSPFLKQLASHVSVDTLQLQFRGMEGFWKVLKFLRSVNERQVIASHQDF